MKTIAHQKKNILEIQKSKFITYLFPLFQKEEVERYLNEVKKEYPDATHYCYAYIFDSYQKASDDKEPSGTAGIPMLEVLKKQELTNILCIVVRYFGGIKLGAGGLIRAYSNSVQEALKKEDIVSFVDGYELEIVVPYSKQKELDYEFKGEQIEKTYGNDITYHILCTEETYQKLKQKYPIQQIKKKKVILEKD